MNDAIPGLEPITDEIAPLTIIRTETALSRFPVHRIAKKGNVRIELKHHASALLWRVSYNSEYGQPGPLAYKLDTLIVNRRIEAQKRPISKVIRLGSLRDIALELGTGDNNTAAVKNALLQNASAFINAKMTYRAADRSEKTLEAAFTRYSVVFTGESLPDGKVADGVFLILNDVYLEVLNAALTRPLDYDYMRNMPPAAQRFYEIVSYQIFAALHHQNERARLRYSEYCLLSTATRYLDFDHIKKQMYKVHRPHLESGYLAKVSYEETVDAEGQPDWWMYYIPGPNASREYHEFTGIRPVGDQKNNKRTSHKVSSTNESLLLPLMDVSDSALPPPLAPIETVQNNQNNTFLPDTLESNSPTALLIEELVTASLNRVDAERFAKNKPEECRRQLVYLPYVAEFKTSRGAYLRRAIENGFGPPHGFEQMRMAEEVKAKRVTKIAQENARKTAEIALIQAEDSRVDNLLKEAEKNAPHVFAGFMAFLDDERAKSEEKYRVFTPSIRARSLKLFDTSAKQRELFRLWEKLSPIQQEQFIAIAVTKTATKPHTDTMVIKNKNNSE